jgi:hypothetical protein
MRRAIWILLLPLACNTQRSPDARDRPPPSSSLTGTMPLHMRNCPSAVRSAKTTSTRTSDGVELTITSDDPSAQADIVALAKAHADMKGPIWFLPAHSGLHSGPGSLGRCPVIHADTTVKVQPIANGVMIQVAARTPDRVAALQQATEARVRVLTPPSS